MKQEIIQKLQAIIIPFMFSLPEEIGNRFEDLWFVFDENSLMFKKKLLVAASHEPTLRTITFYLSAMLIDTFDDKRLKELVVHEVAHAIGMNEAEVTELMEKNK
ncbi:MAG: hypothetical protein U1C56_02650 [Candidatus Curtissbacteria bacterium]|nr:hypothetical protein [Candidatus Curtissbacteria bacterium]